jgi:hypothetical protein
MIGAKAHAANRMERQSCADCATNLLDDPFLA